MPTARKGTRRSQKVRGAEGQMDRSSELPRRGAEREKKLLTAKNAKVREGRGESIVLCLGRQHGFHLGFVIGGSVARSAIDHDHAVAGIHSQGRTEDFLDTFLQ